MILFPVIKKKVNSLFFRGEIFFQIALYLFRRRKRSKKMETGDGEARKTKELNGIMNFLI